ncbi:MAG: sulfatase [Planctomycetaceae bacterium]|nr:sulfatase [Planctomycetaceae bacterium]
MNQAATLRNVTAHLRAVLIAATVIATAVGVNADERPNFIFFITDDISPDDLPVYGNSCVQAPNLTRIAENGLVFDNAVLTISSCSPSRCSIITGRYPHNTGAPELHTSLPASQQTFVQELRKAGYYTVLSGKNHMGKPGDLGFDDASDGKPSGCEKWVNHLRDRPQDKPFFCWFASHDAHHPFTPTKDAPNYTAEEVTVPPMLFDGPGTREELAAYYHEVSRTDHFAGELMQELQRQGVAGRTYFIYCSDNGRPFPRCKTYLYDSGIRTPLIVSGPGVTAGRTQSLVSSIDFSATILDLAGVDKPSTVQGVSFRSVLKDPQAVVRDVAFSERNWHVFQLHERSVRFGEWLYIRNAWPDRHNVSGESAWYKFPAAKELWEAAAAGQLTNAQALLTQKPQRAEMLFNVRRDPYQFTDLAGLSEHADTLDRMRSLLNDWAASTGDTVPEHPTPDRGPLHEGGGNIQHGEFPGAAANAETINSPGPLRPAASP